MPGLVPCLPHLVWAGCGPSAHADPSLTLNTRSYAGQIIIFRQATLTGMAGINFQLFSLKLVKLRNKKIYFHECFHDKKSLSFSCKKSFGQKVKMRNNIPYNINFVSDLETRYFNEPSQIQWKKAAWIFLFK